MPRRSVPSASGLVQTDLPTTGFLQKSGSRIGLNRTTLVFASITGAHPRHIAQLINISPKQRDNGC